MLSENAANLLKTLETHAPDGTEAISRAWKDVGNNSEYLSLLSEVSGLDSASSPIVGQIDRIAGSYQEQTRKQVDALIGSAVVPLWNKAYRQGWKTQQQLQQRQLKADDFEDEEDEPLDDDHKKALLLWINSSSSQLSTWMTASAQTALVTTLNTMLVTNSMNPADVVQAIKSQSWFALTPNQATTLANYTAQLQAEVNAGTITAAEMTDAVDIATAAAVDRRATDIVENELVTAYNQGSIAVIEAEQQPGGALEGKTMNKVWEAELDDLTCSDCEDMNGESVGLDEVFSSGDDAPPAHLNCVLPGTTFIAPGGWITLIRGNYSGWVIELYTSENRILSVTENHMLLTPDGFIPAKGLRQGDYIFDCSGLERRVTSDPDIDWQPSVIDKAFMTAQKNSSMITVRMPSSAENLHGDGRFCNGDIDIVTEDGFLRDTGKSSCSQPINEQLFSVTGDSRQLQCSRGLTSMFIALSDAAVSFMGGSRDRLPELWSALGIDEPGSFATAARSYAALFQTCPDGSAANSEGFGDRLFRLPGIISRNNVVNGHLDSQGFNIIAPGNTCTLEAETDTTDAAVVRFSQLCSGLTGLIAPIKLFNVERKFFDGHVYDLQSRSTVYSANGILSSNCRCSLSFEEATP